MANLQDIRKEYAKFELKKTDLLSDPMDQFKIWFHEAEEHQNLEHTAMTLSTMSKTGFPESRVVLLKGISKSGFRFFTNYDSVKAKNIDYSPKASLLFFWPKSERQVRIKGLISKCPVSDSVEYFKSRPQGSQAGAISSNQSQVIESKDELIFEFERLMKTQKLKKPENWGGYDLSPLEIEFWQGGKNRLHDRFRFVKQGSDWKIDRLAP